MKYDAILVEREVSLSKEDLAEIIAALPEEERFIPINIDGEYSSAMGFITDAAAERIDYYLDKGHPFYMSISEILDDMGKENVLGLYNINLKEGDSLKILLTRDLQATLARLNQPAVGVYTFCNTGSVLVHEVDPDGEYVIASINGDDMCVCPLIYGPTEETETEPEFGFYMGEWWIPLSQVMKV